MNVNISKKIYAMVKIYMKKFFISAAFVCIMLLVGCGSSDENNQAQNGVNIIPNIEAFDLDMSKAKFISVGDDFYTEKENGVLSRATDTYTASYEVIPDNSTADFVLSDGYGEFGNMIICRLRENEETAVFSILNMQDGFLDESTEIIGGNVANSDVYSVELEVNGESLHAIVNGTDVGDFKINSFKMASIGTYKGRYGRNAFIDNILVKDINGSILFEEDFENATDNIFAPYYIKVQDGKMSIDYGTMLTKIEGAPAPVFIKNFDVNVDEIDKAYLYMTALGSFDVTVNGKKISEDYSAPGIMAYDTQLKYTSYDVTNLINANNDMRVTLTYGFFGRGMGYAEIVNPVKCNPAIKGEIVIVKKDGNVEIIPTDESFKCSSDGIVRFDDIYQGEIIDSSYAVDESKLKTVSVDAVESKYLNMKLVKNESPSIMKILEFAPISVNEPVPGTYVYDFGQNMSGVVSVDLSKVSKKWEDFGATEGSVITFRYGETLNTELLQNKDDEIGTIYTDNLLTAKATDYFINGSATEDDKIEFRHTSHGFRYLQVTGLKEMIPVEAIKANMLSSNLEATGQFECSNAIINRLYENAKFSLYSNFVGKPTDCNQRDERLGWAGDVQIASDFASYVFNTDKFYRDYIFDMNQRRVNGAYTDIAFASVGGVGNNCWGDAPVILAWNMYLQYGDKDILAENFEQFCEWVDYLVANSDNYIRPDEGYGDHLSLQHTPKDLSNTAYSANSALLVSKMAGVLGNNEAQAKYMEIYNKFKSAWQQKYIRPDASLEAGILYDESETGYALGLAFDLFNEEMREKASQRLSILAEYSGYKFCTGYAGLNYILPVLSDNGQADTAMKMLETIAPETLLYIIASGQTSLPEGMETILYSDDGSYTITGSLNHQAYSGTCAYFYNGILGIKPDEKGPGYKYFNIEPKVAGELTYAKGSLKTQYGTIEVEWHSDENGNSLKCVIPENTTCMVVLPNGEKAEKEGGEYTFNW